MTRLRSIPKPLGNGYPAFKDYNEQKVVMTSPSVFAGITTPMSDPSFRNLQYLGSLAVSSIAVRHALMSLAFAGTLSGEGRGQVLVLKHYQMCVVELKERLCNDDTALVAMLLLAIVENQKLGDIKICLQHYATLCRMLISRISSSELESRKDLYRVIAEATIFKLATLSPFMLDVVIPDWGDAFDVLFPDDSRTSPFLGGMHQIYGIMLQLSRHSTMTQATEIGRKLDEVERVVYTDTVMLEPYQNSHLLNITALRLQLLKISDPSLTTSSPQVHILLRRGLAILKSIDLQRLRNPTIMIPLIMLACAAEEESDFNFITARSNESFMRPSDKTRLQGALQVLRKYRSQSLRMPENQLDYVVMLHELQ